MLQPFGNIIDGGDLRHAYAGDDARGANGAGADADFHTVRAMVHQGPCRIPCGDVATYHLHVRIACLYPFHAIQHTLGMAMCRINDQQIDTRLDQRRDAIVRALAHPDGGADPQLTLFVLAGVGMFLGLEDVLDGNETAQLEFVVDDQHPLQAVLVQQHRRLFQRRTFLDGDQPLAGGHDVFDRLLEIVLEAEIAVGDYADHLAAIQHRQAGDFVLPSQRQHVPYQHLLRHGNWILDHTALESLDLGHVSRLGFDWHILVDDADAAFLRERNSQASFCHRVHGGGHDGQVQADFSGDAGDKTYIARQD